MQQTKFVTSLYWKVKNDYQKHFDVYEVADKVPSIFRKTETREHLSQILLLVAH